MNNITILQQPRTSTRDLANQLGDYFDAKPIARIEPIAMPVGLNPRAWPPCKHCGGNVHCENYDPDTQAPLWGQDNERIAR